MLLAAVRLNLPSIFISGGPMMAGNLCKGGKVQKIDDTAILKGYQLFHNYIRPHEALDGKTPAEACGIKVEGENKWKTLIQNASKKN
jgi:hypothetical protein